MEIYALGLAIIVGLIWLAVRVSKGAGYTEAQLETEEAENEIKEENRKAAWSNLDIINKLDDAHVKQLLKDKWTRK
jgi:hypothetical protein